MAHSKSTYRIKLPLTLEEYRKGQRYVLCKMTTDEVEFLKHVREESNDKLITETHKILNLTKKMPYLVKKVIPTDACIVEEYSRNIDSLLVTDGKNIGRRIKDVERMIPRKGKEFDRAGVLQEVVNKEGRGTREAIEVKEFGDESNGKMKEFIDRLPETHDKQETHHKPEIHNLELNNKSETHNLELNNTNSYSHDCLTTYKNKYFDENTFKMTIHTKITLDDSYETGIKIEDIDFRTYKKAKLHKVSDRDYSGEYSERFPVIYCYKTVEIQIESVVLGWIAKEINKVLKNLLIEVQQSIITTYDEWKDLSDEQLKELEKKTVETFMKK